MFAFSGRPFAISPAVGSLCLACAQPPASLPGAGRGWASWQASRALRAQPWTKVVYYFLLREARQSTRARLPRRPIGELGKSTFPGGPAAIGCGGCQSSGHPARMQRRVLGDAITRVEEEEPSPSTRCGGSPNKGRGLGKGGSAAQPSPGAPAERSGLSAKSGNPSLLLSLPPALPLSASRPPAAAGAELVLLPVPLPQL